MKETKFSYIDLFAGIGGFRQAMDSIGGECVFSSEIDKFACQTYFENYGEYPHGDITKIKEVDIPHHDILCGGFPCQAFSISGKQKGFEDARGTLFFDIARIANQVKPKVLFLENVPNLLKHNNGETFSQMKHILSGLGYTVFFKILNASDFGVPQLRKRLYIVAFRKELNVLNFSFPEGVKRNVLVSDILQNDADVEQYIIKKDSIISNEKADDKSHVKSIRIGYVNKGGQGDRIYSVNALGITLSAHGGGTGAKTGLYLVNNVVRKLSPRECARMQGFKDDFIISVSDAQAWKQFGNSVAIPVLNAISVEIEKALERDILNKKK